MGIFAALIEKTPPHPRGYRKVATKWLHRLSITELELMFEPAVERRAIAANQGAPEIAASLLRWCPDRARELALAMHELAAWQYDDHQTEHWLRVLRLLPLN